MNRTTPQGLDSATLPLEAIAQRAVRIPEGWDWESLAATCECGLLLAPLPAPVRLPRVVVIFGRALPVTYEMTHAHAAAADDGRLICPDCAPDREACQKHDQDMCDTPQPVECCRCPDGFALPGLDHCLDCRPYEPEWDRDHFPGCYL